MRASNRHPIEKMKQLKGNAMSSLVGIRSWGAALGLAAISCSMSPAVNNHAAEAVVPWTPVGIAVWDSESPPALSARLEPVPVSMSGWAEVRVLLRNTGGPVYVSRFFGSTRGIAWEVRDSNGRQRAPFEPMPISPPEPPPLPFSAEQSLEEMGQGMILVPRGGSITVTASERALWMYPGPGSWDLRAHILIRNYSPTTSRGGSTETEIRLVSEPTRVLVTP